MLKNINKKIFIGGAWPYANGSLHIGHIAALLPGDILARYYRCSGAEVLYVSGSDCHGTPISVRAASEGTSPAEIAARYHAEFQDNFEKLGFSYDCYSSTSCANHIQNVQKIINKFYIKGLLYDKSEQAVFCTDCKRFLPDRYISGTCVVCGNSAAKGDQCDNCGALPDFDGLREKRCALCGAEPAVKNTKHLYLQLSDCQQYLEQLVAEQGAVWRQNAVKTATRYLNEGFRDRAVSRDLDWGIDIPVSGYDGKKVYVWFEAVLGYLSASRIWAENKGCASDWSKFWNKDAVAYLVHGKDNIPFHTLIFPGLLKCADIETAPLRIVSSEYLTLEGRKISTSGNWAVWLPDYLAKYDPDPLRYFLTVNGPEKRDSDFSWPEFVERNNNELLGAFGNFVNRTLALSVREFGNVVPAVSEYSSADYEFRSKLSEVFDKAGTLIEQTEFKDALKLIFEQVREANRYFDYSAPWRLVKHDRERAAAVLRTCLDAVLNLATLCEPFLPHISAGALQYLHSTAEWRYRELPDGNPAEHNAVLVKRLERQ